MVFFATQKKWWIFCMGILIQPHLSIHTCMHATAHGLSVFRSVCLVCLLVVLVPAQPTKQMWITCFHLRLFRALKFLWACAILYEKLVARKLVWVEECSAGTFFEWTKRLLCKKICQQDCLSPAQMIVCSKSRLWATITKQCLPNFQAWVGCVLPHPHKLCGGGLRSGQGVKILTSSTMLLLHHASG